MKRTGEAELPQPGTRLPRGGGGVTFRELHGPGPAEGARQAAELHVELLHRALHHRCVLRRLRSRCGRVRPLRCGGPGSTGAGAGTLIRTRTDLATHVVLLHSQPRLAQLLPVVVALCILGSVVKMLHLWKFRGETLSCAILVSPPQVAAGSARYTRFKSNNTHRTVPKTLIY